MPKQVDYTVPDGPFMAPPPSTPIVKPVINVTIPISVTDKMCADLMCTALEGGIGYWCAASHIERSAGEDWHYIGFKAHDTCNSIKDADFPPTVVDYDTIRLGVLRFFLLPTMSANNKGALLQDILEDELGCRTDATTADSIVQLGMFDEIVYG